VVFPGRSLADQVRASVCSRVFKAEIRMNLTKPEPQAINRATPSSCLGAGAIVLVALVAYYAFAAITRHCRGRALSALSAC
jgi:hypothetical protein